jgi:hypothetical protein
MKALEKEGPPSHPAEILKAFTSLRGVGDRGRGARPCDTKKAERELAIVEFFLDPNAYSVIM